MSTTTGSRRSSSSSTKSRGAAGKTAAAAKGGRRSHGGGRGKAASSGRSASTKSSSTTTSRANGGGGRSAKGSNTAQMTIDHDEIRQWAEARGGKPACVMGTGGGGDAGLLRLDFPGYSGAGKLRAISWDEFFEKFDENNLALVYQEKTASGEQSNFNKLVSRDSAAGAKGGTSRARHGRGSD